MLEKIEKWIDFTLGNFLGQRQSCELLSQPFEGFYRPEFLKSISFIVVDDVPKPDFPELREAGLGALIESRALGVTYKNAYFIKRGYEQDLRIHFHELVHVLQWRNLGTKGFVSRYIKELNTFGYIQSPLEVMAYSLDTHFATHQGGIDIESYVEHHL